MAKTLIFYLFFVYLDFDVDCIEKIWNIFLKGKKKNLSLIYNLMLIIKSNSIFFFQFIALGGSIVPILNYSI